jgi:predicted dinucleotide-binding enzyme
MGTPLGRIWAQAGHRVVFCFGRDRRRLEEVARTAGPAARVASPAEAVAAAEVAVLAVPWGEVDQALGEAGPLDGKVLLSIVNPLKPDLSGLAIGTTTSCAEEIAAKAPGARLVAAIPPFAEVLASPSRRFGGEQPAVFYCGDDVPAKVAVADLLSDIDVAPVDVGPLRNARYVEPAGFLLVQIQYAPGAHGQYGLRLLTREV